MLDHVDENQIDASDLDCQGGRREVKLFWAQTLQAINFIIEILTSG
jgi:hypothetical protein